MKLIIAIVRDRDVGELSTALLAEGIRFTKIGSTGGFLREGSTTFLMGVSPSAVDPILRTLKRIGHVREEVCPLVTHEAGTGLALMAGSIRTQVGGGVAFVVDVDQFERY